jgi:hypothetical protein
MGNTKSNLVLEEHVAAYPGMEMVDSPSQEQANAYVEEKYAHRRFTAPPPLGEEEAVGAMIAKFEKEKEAAAATGTEAVGGTDEDAKVEEAAE